MGRRSRTRKRARRAAIEPPAQPTSAPSSGSTLIPNLRDSGARDSATYLLQKDEYVWGLDSSDGVWQLSRCRVLQCSGSTWSVSSPSYYVEFVYSAKCGDRSRLVWLSRDSILPDSQLNREIAGKFNREAIIKRKTLELQKTGPVKRPVTRSVTKSKWIRATRRIQPPQEHVQVGSTPTRESGKGDRPQNKSDIVLEGKTGPKSRWFPFISVGDPRMSAGQIKQHSLSPSSVHNTHLSPMHEPLIYTLTFAAGLRKDSIARYGRDDNSADDTIRYRRVTFAYAAVSSATEREAFLIISICKKPHIFSPPELEYHPKCLRMLLNGCVVNTRIPDGKAPYPTLPFEIPLAALQTENELVISWTESTPADLAMDYCAHIYVARRKQLPSIVADIRNNVLPIAQSLTQERTRCGADQDVVAETRSLSLNCPISKKRIALPVRGRKCRHFGCFDALSYLAINVGATARFLCPLCAQIIIPQDLLVDAFFLEIVCFTSKERIELVQDRTGITVRESTEDFTKGPTGFVTIDDNSNDGKVIRID